MTDDDPTVCDATIGGPGNGGTPGNGSTAVGGADDGTLLSGILPGTGSALTWWALLIALAMIVAGLVLLRSRHRRTTTALALAGLAAGLGLSVAAPAPVQAQPEPVYAGECTLIEVTDVVTQPTDDLLPGDEVDLIAATVTNRYDAPITLRLSATHRDGSAPVTAATTASLTAAGTTLADGPVDSLAEASTESTTLQPGQSVPVGLGLRIDLSLGDDGQGAATDLTLTIHATETP